jgi:hypothetical protein
LDLTSSDTSSVEDENETRPRRRGEEEDDQEQEQEEEEEEEDVEIAAAVRELLKKQPPRPRFNVCKVGSRNCVAGVCVSYPDPHSIGAWIRIRILNVDLDPEGSGLTTSFLVLVHNKKNPRARF